MARLIAALALSLAACGARADRGPAWPERTEPEIDGGESLAPRSPSVLAASESKAETKEADKADKADKAVTPDPAVEKAEDAKPAEKAATTTEPEDVIIIDDIVIEIED